MIQKTLLIATSITAHILLMNTSLAEDSINLPDLTITGEKDPARSNLPDLKESLSNVPGATNLLNLDDLFTSKATLNDVLGNEPGVIMQEFFGGNDQPRLNIRGSGIQDNPVARGVQLLYDGLAINQADGSFVIGLLPTEQMRYMSVYRGANALQYGGSTLGGAINMTSRTALNSDNFIRLQAGSCDSFNGSIGMGGYSREVGLLSRSRSF